MIQPRAYSITYVLSVSGGGSIPTAPTNISFINNSLCLFEGPQGAINARRLAQGALGEQLCYSPFLEP
jgi:hypothetical protein